MIRGSREFPFLKIRLTSHTRRNATNEQKTGTAEGSRIYEPLDASKRQIRVLELHPGTRDDVVRVSLRITSLPASTIPGSERKADHVPSPMVEYEAISYCWGDTTAKTEMLVNGILFNAPASAVEVVRNFRLEEGSRVM